MTRIIWENLCGQNSSPYVPNSKYKFSDALESSNLSDITYPIYPFKAIYSILTARIYNFEYFHTQNSV